MAQLVYLPTVCKESWQLWNSNGESSCLRDYRISPTEENRNLSTREIKSMLKLSKHECEKAPHVTFKDADFWRERIRIKNTKMDLDPIEDVIEGANGYRLQTLFASRIKQLLSEERHEKLARFMREWIGGFSHVVDRGKFNHWDDTDASEYREIEDGFSWTARMLEYCRSTKEIGFVSTNDSDLDFRLDFGLFAAEVCFGLSSKDNPFQEGQKNSIQPDGLGLRRDHSIVVFEMKGPQDDHDPYTAMLQALCGALAVTAKRDWIVKTAATATEGSRRPSISLADVNNDAFSVNLYVVIVPKEGESISINGDKRLDDSIPRIKTAFPQLGDIVFFVPSRSQFDKIERLSADLVYP